MTESAAVAPSAPPLTRRACWGYAFVALAGSVLLGCASPPGGWVPLVWIGFAPFVFVARVAAERSHGWRVPFFLGWFGALGVGLVGFPWIALTLERFAELPMAVAVFGLLLFSAWTAIPYGFWLILMARGPQRGLAAWAVPVLAWPPLSAAWPSLFPYTPVIGLGEAPAWMQMAELGGVGLVEAWAVLAGVAWAHAWRAPGMPAKLRLVALALAIPAALAGYGRLRMDAIAEAEASARTVRIALVQPNVPLGWRQPEANLRRLQEQSALAQAEGAELVIWPEAGAFPYVVRLPFTRDRSGRRRIQAMHTLPTVFGVATRDPALPYEHNSVAAMDGQGRVIGLYHKNILVPFGERIPIVDPAWARQFIPAMSHNLPGDGPARFVVPIADGRDVRLGPLICYEDIFASFARAVAAQDGGIELFVNSTIDTWFGDTAEPWEHLALAQFRSVEHRLPMVRAVAAGTSSYVDARGRVRAALDVTDPRPGNVPPATRWVGDVALPRDSARDPTPYARGGWLFTPLAGVVALALFLRGRVRRRATPAHAIQRSEP